MLSINMDDVINVLDSIKPQLIGFGIVALLAIVASIACGKLAKSRKYLIRAQAGMAVFLALVVTVNLICFGPMSTMISLATGGGTISEESSAQATELCTEISEEGIVLLENDGTLPLADKKINVFGWASTNPGYGGTGSGALNQEYHTVSLLEGLSNAGIEYNTELRDFYKAYSSRRPSVRMKSQDWSLPEVPAAQYTDEMMARAKEFSDTAMIVITRVGGENADLPTDMAAVIDGSWNDGSSYRNSSFTNNGDYNEFEKGQHFLELSKSEKDMIDLVTANFDKVVLVYNGANAFELGFVEDYSQIKSVLWCPGPGQSGFNAFGKILTGEINPSGKTTDTFVYDLTQTPTWNNFGKFTYTNMDEFAVGKNNTLPCFVNYVEGIYVGYRFYETAAKEGLIDYDKTVQYPFGYGLSYTEFSQTMGEIQLDGNQATVDVTVTNTGAVAGKNVVELYYDPPYTNGGIEKASANLLAFGKTQLLEPGASETVTLSFQLSDMASYDTYGTGGYVLEPGDYTLSINSDSHTVIDSKVCTIDAAAAQQAAAENPASNQFTAAEGDVTYLSRADGFANYAEATAAPASYEMPAEDKAAFMNNSNYDPAAYNNPDDAMPTTGANNKLQLVDLRGAAYDDAKWDQLLDQMTVEEMDSLIALGGYQTNSVESIGKVRTNDCDGPASINNNFTKVGSIGFPAAVMIANTWNTELATRFGESIGKMADEMDVSGWYAPAMNTHRSAFAGRNFEYYSEDGLLAGQMASHAVQGAAEYGVYAYLKHFALNDQEQGRNDMICTWSNEQAIREIYLKPFRICVEEGGAQAIMSAYNYIGVTPACGYSELLNNVLRGEWGFVGMVLTDYYGVYGYMDADRCIRNGNDFCLVNYDTATNHLSDLESATSVAAMRQACKNILYVVVNSRAYSEENFNAGLAGWKLLAIGLDALLLCVFAGLEVLIAKGYKKRKNSEPAADNNKETIQKSQN